MKVGDRVSFTEDDETGTGESVAIDASGSFIVCVDGAPAWAWEVTPTQPTRCGVKLAPGVKYWWVQHTNAKPEGQKDDSAKLRMDLIPAKSLRLILEHVYNRDLEAPGTNEPANATDCLEQLLLWRESGDVKHLAFAASHALELCGSGLWATSPEGLEEVARVLKYGAFDAPRPDGTKGYGENNWQLVPNAENRYYAAALRHWSKAQKGEERDVDSGHKHVGHLACCLLFLLYVCG